MSDQLVCDRHPFCQSQGCEADPANCQRVRDLRGGVNKRPDLMTHYETAEYRLMLKALVAGQLNPQTVGQLQLGNFPNEAGLEALGNNLLLETPASGQATTGNPGAIGEPLRSRGSPHRTCPRAPAREQIVNDVCVEWCRTAFGNCITSK